MPTYDEALAGVFNFMYFVMAVVCVFPTKALIPKLASPIILEGPNEANDHCAVRQMRAR